MAAGAMGGWLAGCKPQEVVVEKVVKETVVGEKEVELQAQDPVTINFWGWPSLVMDDKLEIFHETVPNITVNLSDVGETVFGSQKYLTAIAAGAGPDVTVANRHTFLQFAAKGMYLDVTPYFDAAGLTRGDYLSVQLDETTWDGKLYGLPISTDVRYLYWNRDHFEEVGLDPDSPPTTYAELAEYTEKLTVRNGDEIDRYGFVPYGYGNSWMWLYGFAFDAPSISDDKRTILCDDPRWISMLEWMVDFYDNYVGDYEMANTFAASISAAGLGAPFDAGKVSMVADGDWAVTSRLRDPDLNWDAAPMPIPPNGVTATWSCGYSLVVVPSSKEVEAAWDFIKWYTTEEGWKAEAEAQKAETVRIWQREQIEGTPLYFPTLACHLPSLEMLEQEHITGLSEREQRVWAMELDLLQSYTRGCGTEMGLAALDYWTAMDTAARMALSHELSPEEALLQAKDEAQKAPDEAWEALDA